MGADRSEGPMTTEGWVAAFKNGLEWLRKEGFRLARTAGNDAGMLVPAEDEEIELLLRRYVGADAKKEYGTMGGTRARYTGLFESWVSDREVMRSEGAGMGHPAFRQILALGRDGIRFILEDIGDGKDMPPAVHALIVRHVGYDPVPGTITSSGDQKAVQASLLTWGREAKRI
jgi:hypothetical protein